MNQTDADFIARRLDGLNIPTHRDGKPIPLAARVDIALSRLLAADETLATVRRLATLALPDAP